MSYEAGFSHRSIEVWAPQVQELLTRLQDVAYVAGGAARELVMRKEAPAAEDVDVFLYDEGRFDECCRTLTSLGYQAHAVSAFAASYVRDWVFELPVQVIRPAKDNWSLTWGEPEAVLSHFSFTTEQFAVAEQAIVGADAEADTRSRRLRVANVTDPVQVALRATKYAAKGYHIEQSEMQRIFDAAIVRAMHG